MELPRRRLLRLTGMTCASMLAGCFDTNQETETATSTSAPSTQVTPSPATSTPDEIAIPDSEAAVLRPDDGEFDTSFGSAVALSSDGTTGVIGAAHNENSSDGVTGCAYIFTDTGDSWSQQATLVPESAAPDPHYLCEVALSSDGTTALVGADGDEISDNNRAGSVYVFDGSGDTWTGQGRFTPDDSDGGQRFGSALALSDDGTTACIGADGDEPNGVSSGSAYIFEASRSTWTQEAKLIPDDGAQWDIFGGTVAMSDDGTTVAIGAPRDWPDHEAPGSVYLFDGNGSTWTQSATLTSGADVDADQFGSEVVLTSDGSTALIADPAADTPGGGYVFTATDGTWTQQATLTAPDGEQYESGNLTAAIAGNGTIALIGDESRSSSNGPAEGVVDVFHGTDGGWHHESRITASDGEAGDVFGSAMTVSDSGVTTLIGAPSDDNSNGFDSGSTYVFTV